MRILLSLFKGELEKVFFGLIGLICLLGLPISCTDDAESDAEWVKVELTPYYNIYSKAEEMKTRGDDDPVPVFTYSHTWYDSEHTHQFYKYSDLYPHSSMENPTIHTWFVMAENEKIHQGTFTYTGTNEGVDNWESHATTINGKDYYVYGFMPENAVTSSDISKLPSETYENGAQLTLRGIAAVTNKDICVIVGVGTTLEDIQNTAAPNPEWGRFGRFDYLGRAKGNNKIYLLLDHLYTNINLEYQVIDKYAALRTIKLKSVTMETTNAATVDMTIPINKVVGKTFEPPVGTITTTKNGSNCTVEVFSNTDGEEIPSVGSGNKLSVPSYFTPAISGTFTITSTYDVYDKKNNPVRKNQSAVNKIRLTQTMEKGVSYKVEFTVEPTYLYQLSEPDPDNPTIKLKE